MRRAIRTLLSLGALMATLAQGAIGCRREAESVPVPASAPAPPPAPPIDRVLPGELVEGPEDAFGLPIPRRMSVKARFPDAVFATGDLAAEQVASYVRRRVAAARVETGPARTVFAEAALSRAPSRPLRIEVIARGSETTLVVRDETRPPAKEGLSEEQRWRELGLTPKGAPLDPTRLE